MQNSSLLLAMLQLSYRCYTAALLHPPLTLTNYIHNFQVNQHMITLFQTPQPIGLLLHSL